MLERAGVSEGRDRGERRFERENAPGKRERSDY